MQPLYIGLVIVALLVVYLTWARRPVKGIVNINAGALSAKLKQGSSSIEIIDVREPYEFSGGHIAKAKNIPLGQLGKQLGQLPKGKEIVFVCRSGNRSMQAARMAAKEGIENIHNLSGGMTQWTGPVKKK